MHQGPGERGASAPCLRSAVPGERGASAPCLRSAAPGERAASAPLSGRSASPASGGRQPPVSDRAERAGVSPLSAEHPKFQTQNRRIGKLKNLRGARRRLSSSAQSTASAFSDLGVFSRPRTPMARVSAFTLLSSTRQTRAKPLIPLEEFSRFFGMATVFELGKEPGAGVTFLSMSTSDETMTSLRRVGRAGGVSPLSSRPDRGLTPPARPEPTITDRGLTPPARHGTADHRQGADAPRSPRFLLNPGGPDGWTGTGSIASGS